MYHSVQETKKSNSRLRNTPSKAKDETISRTRSSNIVIRRCKAIVKVRFLGHLRTRTRISEIEINIADEEPLYVLLDKLTNSYSELYDVVKNVKEGLGEYLLLVNDVDVNVYGGINKVKVKNNDVITFVPIVHGGRT